ncbi:MAG: hypothetical protein AABP62_08985 [Planctomycetota bacterium]
MIGRRSRLGWSSACLVLGLLVGSGRAEEQFLDFLHGLHDDGYGELSVLYMNQIKDRPGLPEELTTTWDLEMATSLRIAAEETPNTDLKQKHLVDAQVLLDKFLKEHADHEEAAKAQLTSGDISLYRAQNMLTLALRDKTKREAMLAETRKLFADARPKFEQAEVLYKSQVDELQAGRKKIVGKVAERRAAGIVNQWHSARFKVSTVDFNLGLTFPEMKDPKRKEAFTKAAKGFDAIFQENRSGRVGVYAHMWEGKAREEMEDYVTALDIYDEVMSAQPEKTGTNMAQWMAMFHEVNRYRLMLLGRTKNIEKLITDATIWMAENQSQRRSNGYQGIALELAKAHLEQAKTLQGAAATKSTQEAKKLLAAIVEIRSDFQKEAILIKRLSSGGEEAPLNTFDEAIAIGDAATKAAGDAQTPADAKTNWQVAESAFARAIELSADVKDKNRVLAARFTLSYTQLMTGKPAVSYETAFNLAKETGYTKAPAAAALAVNSALALYGQTKDKAALDKINESTEFLLRQFPQHAEADDARIARGKLKLIQGDANSAIEIFKSVNPASDRFPVALQLAGATHWSMYVDGKRRSDSSAVSHRVSAVELLQQSLAEFRKNTGAGQVSALQETQLLLAEMHLEKNETAAALPLLQPLVDNLKSKQLTSLDRSSLRILVSALRAYAAENQTPQAVEVGQLLLTIGDDLLVVNGVLIEFAKIVRANWKKTANELLAAEQSLEEGRINNAKLAETGSRESLIKVLDQIGIRKQIDLGGLVFLAETRQDLGENDKAREQLQAILDRAASDPAFAKVAAKAATRIRSQLIALLRTDGKFEEALPQVEALLKEQPNALEPLLEKGHLLQALAEKNPQRYDEAVQWWTRIRLKLASSPGKKPVEYYDVIYNCAVCLAAQKKPETSQQAAQLLNSTLALSPDLDGPDRVELFKALLKQLPPPPKPKPAPAPVTKAKSKK